MMKYIKVNGVLYRRAEDPVNVVDSNRLLLAWKSSKEYNEFLPDIVESYVGDWEGLGNALRDKFSMWVNEHLLAPVEESIDWLEEANELARRNR